MSYKQRSQRRPVFILFIIAAVLMAACGAQLGSDNWPGLSAEDNIVYVAYGPRIAAIDITNQRELWTYPDQDSGAMLMAAPELLDDTLYIGDYGQSQGFLSPGVVANVYAIDVSSGTPSQTWVGDNIARDRIVAPALAAAGSVFVGTADNTVVALDAATGDVLWEEAVEHSVWAQPAYADGIVVVASLDRNLYAFDADTGTELWRAAFDGAIHAKPVIVDQTVYAAGFDATVRAYDLRSGNERWRFDTEDWIWNAPAVLGDRLFVGDVKGNVYALGADSGEVVWQQQVDGSVESGLVAYDGTVFVPTVQGVSTGDQSGQLLAFSAADGSELWRNELTSPVFVPPVIADDAVVVLFAVTEGRQKTFEIRVYDPTDGRGLWTYTPTAE